MKVNSFIAHIAMLLNGFELSKIQGIFKFTFMIKSDAFNVYHNPLKTRQKGRGVFQHDSFEGLAWGFENQPESILSWVRPGQG